MEAFVSRQQLLQDLKIVTRACGHGTPIPILSHLLIRVSGQDFLLDGTDLDRRISVQHDPLEYSGEGVVCVPARPLAKILTAMESKTAQLQVDGHDLVVMETGGARTKLKGLDPEHFPKWEDQPAESMMRFGFADLVQAASRVAYAISTEESRFALQAACLHVPLEGDGGWRLVATDGHRLALARYNAVDVLQRGDEDGAPATKWLLPRPIVMDLQALGSTIGNEGTAELTFSTGRALLAHERISIRWHHERGAFPDYDRVMSEPRNMVRVRAVGLVKAAEIAVKLDVPYIGLCIDQERVSLKGRDAENGVEFDRSVPVLEVLRWCGAETKVGIDTEYLRDALQACATDVVQLGGTDSEAALRFWRDDDQAAWDHLVMPAYFDHDKGTVQVPEKEERAGEQTEDSGGRDEGAGGDDGQGAQEVLEGGPDGGGEGDEGQPPADDHERVPA